MPTPAWYDNIRVNRQLFNMKKSIASLPGRNDGTFSRSVVIAAGPSLEKNAHLLLGTEGVFLIAVDAAAPYLFSKGIVPHVVITGEEQSNSALIFKRLDGWFPGVCLVASTTASTLGLYMCSKMGAQLFFYNNAHMALASRFAMKGALPTNFPSLTSLCGSVTFHAVALAGYMGIKDVGIIGADFHVDHADKTHAGEYRVDGIPIDAINQSFEWHARELEIAKAQLLNVTNCTYGGHLEVFKRKPLEEYLKDCKRRVQELPANVG